MDSERNLGFKKLPVCNISWTPETKHKLDMA